MSRPSGLLSPPPHYIIGNWKMNGTRKEAVHITEEIISGIKKISSPKIYPVICPPFTLLDRIGHLLSNSAVSNHSCFLGAQNCSYRSRSPRTGSISAAMLADLDVSFVLLGHSERRARNRESDDEIRQKALAAQEAGITPIICIGENKKIRTEGKTAEFLQQQIQNSVPEHFTGFLSYEPVWAIGQENPAPPSAIKEAAQLIKKILKTKKPDTSPVILYGGSVNSQNAADILNLEDIRGVLLGRASLNAHSFLEVYHVAVATIAAKRQNKLLKTA